MKMLTRRLCYSALIVTLFLVACRPNPGTSFKLSNAFELCNLQDLTLVIKSGDLIVFSDAKDRKLASTENFSDCLVLDNSSHPNFLYFFSYIYDNKPDLTDKDKLQAGQFKRALLHDGFD